MPSQATIEAEAQRLLDEARTKLRSLAQQPSGEPARHASKKLDTQSDALKAGWYRDRERLENEHRIRIEEEAEKQQLPPDEVLRRCFVELPKQLDGDPQIVETDRRYLEDIRNAINDAFANLNC